MERFRQILRALFVVERLPPSPERVRRAPRRHELFRRIFAVEALPPPPEALAHEAEPRASGLGILQALFAIEKLPPYVAPLPQAKPAKSSKAAALFAIEELGIDSPEAPRRRLPLLRWLFWPERLGSEAPGNNDEAR